MASTVHVVFSGRTPQDTEKSFSLMGYFGERGVAYETSRLENYPENDSHGEVGAFVDGTFICYGVIMFNTMEMDKRLRKIREGQLAEMAAIG